MSIKDKKFIDSIESISLFDSIKEICDDSDVFLTSMYDGLSICNDEDDYCIILDILNVFLNTQIQCKKVVLMLESKRGMGWLEETIQDLINIYIRTRQKK